MHRIQTVFKRLTTSVALFLVALVFYACPDRNFPNPNSASEETASVQSLVTGAEGSMRDALGFYIYGTSLIGREAYYFGGDDPRYMSEYVGGALDAGGPFVNNTWNARYRAIANARLLLNRAAQEPPSRAGQRAGLEGFAKTIIAYQLLLNLNLTNENGIKIGYSPNPAAFPFVSKAAGFAEINRLLDEAYAALTSSGAAFDFRLSSGFAGFNTPATFARFNRALRARTAAYTGDYQACLTALSNSFLTETNTAAGMRTGVYHVYSTAAGDQLNPVFEPAAQATRFFAQRDFFRENQDAATDARLSKVFFRSSPVSNYGVSSNYAISVWASNTAPIAIIRNEELLLLRAEARIKTGDFAGALADLNRVRQAAGVAPYAAIADETDGINKVLYERRYSLFCEGHRWIDMRRFNRLNQLPIERSGDQVVVNFPRPLSELP
ncbi:MAG: RagB/SusD family nutrient uptake outer membrane protein [Chloroherpetonaceae bacterium]|nr:RagB/SusD family nutrient uptake outer membrane protein [Chloroherpetonaceae bacterium]